MLEAADLKYALMRIQLLAAKSLVWSEDTLMERMALGRIR